MIAATQNLLNVNQALRDQWFDFWQRAQDIYREAAAPQLADDMRAPRVKELMEKEVSFRSGRYGSARLARRTGKNRQVRDRTIAGQTAGGYDCLSRQKPFDPLIPLIEFATREGSFMVNLEDSPNPFPDLATVGAACR